MNQVEDRRAAISARVKEHYDYLVAAGYDVVFTALQGSQNYGLDEYSDDYCSDVDTKSIVLPCLDDFIKAKQPISAVEIMDNNEHAEVKDIRVMFEMFKKENISYIELLYSDYIVFNPKYEALIKPIFERRDEIATADTAQFLRCIAGMAYEKDKALCHPYPGIIEKIEKYGYDGKQLSHCRRLYYFMQDFAKGKPIAACYKPSDDRKEILMNYKKQLTGAGTPMSVDMAIYFSKTLVEKIKELKDKLIEDGDYGVNGAAALFLDEIKAKILKFKITKEVLMEKYNEFHQLCEDMVYPDEDFKKAEMAAIEKLKVQPQDNIFDYYKEDEDETKS